MNILPLIGSSLKSDEIIDLLDECDTEVIYHFDRLKENQPDQYLIKLHPIGVEMHFDECQVLTTIFLYAQPLNEFDSFEFSESDIQIWDAKSEVIEFANKNALTFVQGNTKLLGAPRDWIKLNYDSYSIHYEFTSQRLSLVTISEL